MSIPEHPLANGTKTISTCRVVLYDKIGPGPHPCHDCGDLVDWLAAYQPGSLCVDHLDWNPLNDAPDNLAPACRRCNTTRRRDGKKPRIREDELSITYPNGTRTRAVAQVCVGCGTDFLASLSNVKKGQGRFCSHSCATRYRYASR